MIPILFDQNAMDFRTHGIGDLIDCIECKAAITDEGEYELTFTYPVEAEMFKELTINRLVVAKVNDYDPYQAFRIYGYEKKLDGTVQINCQHISYDLTNYPVKAFKKYDSTDITTLANAIAAIKANVLPNELNPFGTKDAPIFTLTKYPSSWNPSAVNQDKKFVLDTPTSVRAAILDGDDSLKGTFGGDLYFDNYDIKIMQTGGEDRGVVIEYGVDLMDLEMEENISETITGVLPFWKGRVTADDGSSSGGSTEDEYVYGAVQESVSTYLTRKKIAVLDLSSYYTNQTSKPLASSLNTKAQEWMAAERIGEPEINLTVSYASLGQDVHMYDAVKVHFARMGIDVTAKVSSYTYDVLNERCTEIEVSNVAHSSKWKGLEDASRLRKGLLPPSRIADGSIGGDKLGTGSVGGGALAGGAVDGWHLTDGAVNSPTKVKNGVIEKVKTSSGVQSTLDEVATNSSEIEKIKNGTTKLDLVNLKFNGATVHWKLQNGNVMVEQ